MNQILEVRADNVAETKINFDLTNVMTQVYD